MSLNFDLPKDAELTRKVVREFAEKEIAPVAQDLDDREEFSYDLTRKMGELDRFASPFFLIGHSNQQEGNRYVSFNLNALSFEPSFPV
jgi:hypothetical protein